MPGSASKTNGWAGRDERVRRPATPLPGISFARAAAAAAGIYGNDAVEALYPLLATDSDGKKPDTSASRYTLTFPGWRLASRQRILVGDDV